MDIQQQTGTVYYSRKLNRQERGGLPYESEEAGIYVQFDGGGSPAEIRERALVAYAVARACVLDQLGIGWSWGEDRKSVFELPHVSQAQTPTPAPTPAQTPTPAQAPAPTPAPAQAPAQVGGYDLVSDYDVELSAAALAAADLGSGSPAWFAEALTFGKMKGQSWGALAQGCKTFGSDVRNWCYGLARGNPALNADGSPKNPNYVESNAESTARARACLAWAKAHRDAPPATTAPTPAPAPAPEPLGAIFDGDDCPF